jgi:hypothetical protein
MDLPLRAVGAVSSADHVRGVILAMHDRKGNVIVYSMLVLIFLGCWWVFQAESIDASAWMWCIAVTVIFLGPIGGYCLLLPVRNVLWKRMFKNIPPYEHAITEEGIFTEGQEGTQTMPWNAYFGCRLSDRVVVLFMKFGLWANASLQYHIFSRDLFQNDSDWMKFRDLARLKLPTVVNSLRLIGKLESDMPGNAEQDAMDSSIRIQGTPSQDDAAEAYVLATKRNGFRLDTHWWYIFLASIMLEALVICRLLSDHVASPWMWAYEMTAVPLTLLLFIWLLNYVFKRIALKLARQARHCDYTVTSDGIASRFGPASQTRNWKAFSGYRASDRVAVLYAKSSSEKAEAGFFDIYARALFAEDSQWAAFEDLLRLNLPERPL